VILLDTHVVLWLFLAPEKLSFPAREAILHARIEGEKIGCSPVSIYEIAYAATRKRLHLHTTVEAFIAAVLARIDLVPLTPGIAVCAGGLTDPFHGDPLDRIIAATAITEKCALVTADNQIRVSKICEVIW
jgi:PIN domain nuclease of toxin-antitoxin system